MDKGKEAAW